MSSKGLQPCNTAGRYQDQLQAAGCSPARPAAAAHGAAQSSIHPSSLHHDSMAASAPAVKPECRDASQQPNYCPHQILHIDLARPLTPRAVTGTVLTSTCKAGSELSGRKVKQKQTSVHSEDYPKHSVTAVSGGHAHADLEWAHRAGYYAVLTLGVVAGTLLFAYACAYHLYVVHGNPLALREVPLLGLRPHPTPAIQGGESDGGLASWEELALQHGNEAVIILSDSNHREPILTARSSATEPSHRSASSVDSSAVHSAPVTAAAPGPAKAARTGFLGRMAQHHSQHAKTHNTMDGSVDIGS